MWFPFSRTQLHVKRVIHKYAYKLNKFLIFLEWSMNLDQNLTKCEKEQEANVAHDILFDIIEILCKLLVFHLD